jgi:cobalt-zinc-cadmium efflux system membrane fusion protein
MMFEKPTTRRIAWVTTWAILALVSAIGLWQFRGTLRILTQEGATKPAATNAHSPVSSAQAKVSTSEETEHKHSNGVDDAGGSEAPEPDAQSESEEHHEESIKLSALQLQEFGIELVVASQGPIAVQLERPAEIKFDGDRLIHVVPRVDGVVSEVSVTQGQNVSKDAFLAVLNSRELAELKATYLAAFERRNLARETFERENRLWEKKISSEKDYLDAKTSLAEADIALRASGQKLRALGFSQQYVDSLTNSEATDLTRYEILAPIAGTVIERHLSLGEAVSADKEVFVIADASAVWVEVTIYPKDMSLVRAGQNVQIDIGDDNPIEGQIAFVTPHVSEETRTATARVVVDSADGRLKPGMFV